MVVPGAGSRRRGSVSHLPSAGPAGGEAERAALAERLQGREEQLRQGEGAGCRPGRSRLVARRADPPGRAAFRRRGENSRIPAWKRQSGPRRSSSGASGTNRGSADPPEGGRDEASGGRRAAEEKLALIEDARRQLSDAFQALSDEALRNKQPLSFLELPVRPWEISGGRQERPLPPAIRRSTSSSGP